MRLPLFHRAMLASASILVLLVLQSRPVSGAGDGKELLAKARTHLAKGRYEEALETFHRAAEAKADSVAVAVGESCARQAVGAWEEAEKTIDAALAPQPSNVTLRARRAELQFLRGRFVEAEKRAESVLKTDRENLLARLVLANVHAATGRFAEANEEYRWFIRFYNDRQPEDAASLLLVARGAVPYARWNHNTQIFHFVVNTLCTDALKNDPSAWEASLISGSLLLEKFNREQAIPDLDQALATNPRAAEAIVLKGQDALDQNDPEKAEAKANEALEINGRLPAALRLKADVCFLSGRATQATAALVKALNVNPHDQLSLARAAAFELLEDGLPERAELESWLVRPAQLKSARAPLSRFARRWIEVCDWNPRPGVFLAELGRLLESQRRLDTAEICYRRAIVLMPELPEAKTSLGMLLMSVGKTDEARTILDAAFEADPYHMRVSNFRKVVKLLEGYQAITTEHFVVRVDAKRDKLLGGYMAEYLEEIYPQLVERFGFAPPHRTQFEIFNRANGVSGHEWFSARMVGLPWIQTIGASTGEIVAMASPTSAPAPFNWARVLRHEFVHVITVQQTGFNIPQWFTEALAVLNEGYPPPEAWMDLLRDRLAKGELRTLKTINQGFRRPANSDDWQFTYCQSRLYAEYMIERGGPESLKKMLAAYRKNATTARAIHEVFGVDEAAFERGYREFLNRKVGGLRKVEPRPSKGVEQLEADYQAKPDDPSVGGAYAWSLLEAGNPSLARKVAKETLSKNPREIWASIVLARLDAEDQQYAAAIKRLEGLLNRADPHREVLLTLVKLKLLDEKPFEAAALCELGLKSFSTRGDFMQGLAAAYAQLGDLQKLADTLSRLCELFPDDPAPRKQLAELALKQKRYSDAVRLAKSALHVDVLDADIHRQMGDAYLGIHEGAKALPELEAAAELKPKDNEIELSLSRGLIAAGRRDDAKTHLRAILERDATSADARALFDSIK